MMSKSWQSLRQWSSWRWSAFFVLLLASPAVAQSCPNEYAACDNGGCCLSSEQCCPSMEDGCCNSSTPYCCGDGNCAATPSECPNAERAACDGYDVPCGGGCAPAGSHCCDLAGHYCPPETMCTSDTSCVLGNDASLALLVAVPSSPAEEAESTVSAPFDDPTDATDRSCALSLQRSDIGAEPWLVMLGAMLCLRRRRH